MISAYISSFDKIVSINEMIVANVMNYDDYIHDQIKRIKELDYEEFMNIIKSIDFSNVSSVVIKPSEKSN